MSLAKVGWIELPTKIDPRGALTIVGHDEIPFSIARLFYAHKVPDLSIVRGGHAHRVTEQFVLPVSGQFMLDLTDGKTTNTYVMDTPDRGVYIPPMIWDRLYSFSKDAVCLVLASTQYTESDYIRKWDDYMAAVGESQS